MKAPYLHHYSLRLLVGHLLLTVPSLCVVLIVWVWDIDVLWLPPLLGVIGWILVLPVTYTISRHSKERVAIDALANGLLMLCLCSLTVSVKYILLVKDTPLALSEECGISAYFDQGKRPCKKLIPFCIQTMSRKTRRRARSVFKYVSIPSPKSDTLIGRMQSGISIQYSPPFITQEGFRLRIEEAKLGERI